MDDSNVRRNMAAFLWHGAWLAVTVAFTDVNTVLPGLILQVGGTAVHVGVVTGIMVGVPLASQLLFAGFLHGRRRKKPYLLLGIHMRVFALAALAAAAAVGLRVTLGQLLALIYAALLVFTLSGAFAGISYVDLVGKSFPGIHRRRFVLRRQWITSLGLLLSAVATRAILGNLGSERGYLVLFILSSGVLLIASAGFWVVREEPTRTAPAGRIGTILRSIPSRLRGDRTLRRYIIVANLLGAGTVVTPFYVAMAQDLYGLDTGTIGNLVLVQIGGMIAGNLIWHRVVRRRGFKGMIRTWAVLGFLTPPIALTAGHWLPLEGFLPVFVLTGLYLGSQKVTADAVLLEISTEENRALYAGIFGTFNLSLALLPILLGGLVAWVGFTPIFLFVSLLAVVAAAAARGMDCPVDRIHPSPLSDDIVKA